MRMRQPKGRGACHVRALGVSVVCLGGLAGYALAHGTAPSEESRATREAGFTGVPGRGLADNAGIEAGGSAGKTAARPGRGSELTMNPDAKWACEQQTVIAAPIWRGQTNLTFTFDIRNEGTADLRIRAKGG